jgi:YjbE family integral membrane protein
MIDFGIDPSTAFATILVPLQILFVNLLLSADNALVIAMACRRLPAQDMQRAALFGIIGAISLRLVMGSVAQVLLRLPFLQLAAGVILLLIAVRLTLLRDDAETRAALDADPSNAEASRQRGRADFLDAVWAIIVADAAMSLDNVVAIAAIAQGSLVYIVLGLAMSIPMLLWGSALIRQFIDKNGIFVLLAGMFLGWIAGGIAVSDPIIAPSIAANAPALAYAAPLACAIFVTWQSLILRPRRESPRGKHGE